MLAHPSRPVDPNHATYDGEQLRRASDGVVLGGRNDERRGLITHIVVLPGVRAIHREAFDSCSSLSSVTLPEGLATIGEAAFFGCTSLSSVLLPEGLTTIEEWAFYGCTSLSSLSIPSSVPLVYTATWEDVDDQPDFSISVVAPSAFVGCDLLSQLSAAKTMSVEQFLRWRYRAPRQRYAVQAALLRLRTELYERQRKRARRATEEVVDGGEEEEEEEGQQPEAQELQGKLAFDIITSEDVWRHILEFL
jgi:hypothetical protein